MFHNVCRLCLGTEELIWIFNEKMADNMPEIIEVTSGVQITKSDTVTQMVCSTCCQITIKMYKFRTTSIKNDKDLKARCAGYNISQLRNSIVQTKQELAIANTVAASDNINSSGSSTATNATSISAAPTLPVPKFQIPQKFKSAHPSIKQILKQNPNIQLPNVSMKSHFGAYITLLTDEVDEWYKEKNYTDSEIAEIKQSAVKYAIEFENPTPKPQRKRRRKSSIESASSSSSKSSSSKKLALDKSGSESATHKWKRIKLNSDISKSNADAVSASTIGTTKPNEATADKVKDSSVIKPATVPKMVISMTKSSVSPTDKTNAETASKPSVHAKVQLDSNSNSNTKFNANVSTSVKTASTNIPKSSANVSSKSGASVKSNYSANSKVELKINSTTPTVGSATVTTNVSGTEWISKESAKPADATKSTESASILNSMLRVEDPPRNREAEITLTSILATKDSSKRKYTEPVSDSDGEDAGDDPSYEPEATDDASDAEVIEIDEPGKKTERSLRKKSDQPQHRTKPKDEYTLFTTRPFVRNATNVRQSKSDPRTQNCENAELFVLSDSDDERTDANQSANKNADNGSDNSDPIIVDIDSSETSSVQSSKENSDQTKTTNMPDLSLVSVTHKSCTLFICKVCDGHYHSLKDLKVHERRTHTKCPFCNKKFRSLASRDEHVKYTCIINNAPFELKNPKLELIRVDEIEEIRKQYASAFEEMLNYASESNPSESGTEDTTTANKGVLKQSVALPAPPPLPPPPPPLPQQQQQQPVEKDRRRHDEETTDTVSEFEKFLQAAVTHSPSAQTTNSTLTEGTASSSEAPAAESVEATTSSNNGDIICISDDEADTSSPIKPQSKPKIKIINNDILKSINLHDSDANVLKNILTRTRLRKTDGKTISIDALKNYSILDGGTSRIKVFKDLRKHLQHYKIPIEIQYNPNLNVEYKYAAVPPVKKTTDLWSKMVPHDLKIPVPMQPSKPPTHPSKPPTQPSKPPPLYNTAIAGLSTPQVKNTSLILRTQPSNTPQIMTSTSNVFNSAVSQSPGFVTMAQVASVVSSSNIVSGSNNLVFTSQPSALVTSNVNDHCYSTPMVLNGAPSICTNNTTNNITNFILVSGALVPTAEKISKASLPAAQGPLPIIQYVTSAAQEPREPITITEVPSPTTSSAPVSSAIRVKNLSELS